MSGGISTVSAWLEGAGSSAFERSVHKIEETRSYEVSQVGKEDVGMAYSVLLKYKNFNRENKTKKPK